jgi:predicted naringenin-chalcone synthase
VTRPRINALSTAVPDQDIHAAFVDWARGQLPDARAQKLFDRMAARSGISSRFSVFPPTVDGGSPVDPSGFYGCQPLPPTSARMAIYAQYAPELAIKAIKDLGPLPHITHLVVASCTGFVAPGVDQIIAARLGLAPSVERLLIGFMGCYAAVTALKSARHIVRSDPEARVLLVTVELASCHLRSVDDVESLLAMLQFGDGAAAAIVTAQGEGMALDSGFAATLPDSAELIRWDIGDQGFAMHLSGEVPGRIATALADPELRNQMCDGLDPAQLAWAVHAGGRSILDAVEHGLRLPPALLTNSRAVLADYGNMSSATLLFVLARMMAEKPKSGIALAFGPGLAAEGLRFGWCDDA